jgi:hypothetical protein
MAMGMAVYVRSSGGIAVHDRDTGYILAQRKVNKWGVPPARRTLGLQRQHADHGEFVGHDASVAGLTRETYPCPIRL